MVVDLLEVSKVSLFSKRQGARPPQVLFHTKQTALQTPTSHRIVNVKWQEIRPFSRTKIRNPQAEMDAIHTPPKPIPAYWEVQRIPGKRNVPVQALREWLLTDEFVDSTGTERRVCDLALRDETEGNTQTLILMYADENGSPMPHPSHIGYVVTAAGQIYRIVSCHLKLLRYFVEWANVENEALEARELGLVADLH